MCFKNDYKNFYLKFFCRRKIKNKRTLSYLNSVRFYKKECISLSDDSTRPARVMWIWKTENNISSNMQNFAWNYTAVFQGWEPSDSHGKKCFGYILMRPKFQVSYRFSFSQGVADEPTNKAIEEICGKSWSTYYTV